LNFESLFEFCVTGLGVAVAAPTGRTEGPDIEYEDVEGFWFIGEVWFAVVTWFVAGLASMLRFAGPEIVTFGLVAVEERSDFSVPVSIRANGSLARTVDFGEGVVFLGWDASKGGWCESVFASSDAGR
jgi:hypothetical protein